MMSNTTVENTSATSRKAITSYHCIICHVVILSFQNKKLWGTTTGVVCLMLGKALGKLLKEHLNQSVHKIKAILSEGYYGILVDILCT